MTKSIWVPKSELKVTVSDGKVNVWDEMTMQEKPLASQPAGFALGHAVAQATPTGTPPHVEILENVRRQVAKSHKSWKDR